MRADHPLSYGHSRLSSTAVFGAFDDLSCDILFHFFCGSLIFINNNMDLTRRFFDYSSQYLDATR